jgi:hypothetical protein
LHVRPRFPADLGVVGLVELLFSGRLARNKIKQSGVAIPLASRTGADICARPERLLRQLPLKGVPGRLDPGHLGKYPKPEGASGRSPLRPAPTSSTRTLKRHEERLE